MYLVIKGDRLIRDVQEDFSLEYPFLKLEFFKNGHRAMLRQVPQHLRVSDAWGLNKSEGHLEIRNTMTVAELESMLADRFGLSAQLFRKSGKLWLETTITDAWTLKQQNDHGREISTEPVRPGANDIRDYDLDR